MTSHTQNGSAKCQTCGANWVAGTFTVGCPECGGGALTRSCVNCGGGCGVLSIRQIQDSWDTGEAHWLIPCGWRTWLDEAALPARRLIILLGSDLECFLKTEDGLQPFDSRETAIAWLSEEGFIPEGDVAH